MSPQEHDIPALAELRDHFREAARRDIEARPRRRRDRRRPVLLIAAGLALCGGAAAGAAQLLSTGEPVKNAYTPAARYRSPNGYHIVLKAHAPVLPWGVAIYTTRDGEECILYGRVNGAALGLLQGGKFRPYAPNHSAACRDIDRKPYLLTDLSFRDGVSLLYGRVGPGKTRFTVVVDGKSVSTPAGEGGAFLLVFKGRVMPTKAFAS
jgi:hypothetical protein